MDSIVKLLMTDLSPEVTAQCKEALAKQNIHLTVCEKDGKKALAAIRECKPTAVLLDAFLPGLDAISVKQKFDESGGSGTTFFVTGSFLDDALESEMIEKGFSFYFLKPFDPAMLARRVLEASGRQMHPATQVDDECTVT
ncbi:MAG: response regulator [Ruthenibacterium sp.]